MTPRRVETLVSAALAIVALLAVSYLAIQGVQIAQGALINAVALAVAQLLVAFDPAKIDDPRVYVVALTGAAVRAAAGAAMAWSNTPHPSPPVVPKP